VAAGEPLYVVALDAGRARVVVGPREALRTERVLLRDFNWLGDVALAALSAEGIDLYARVRSTRPPAPARLALEGGRAVVHLVGGETGVAPGQACVLYDRADAEARVLGGGVIVGGSADRRADAA